jgi:tRNA uridine 5-carboxymethylaminomethyl modification enzyme
MPVDIQEKIIQTVPGLEGAQIIRPGYAVAYDYLKSGQLDAGLGVLGVPGLFSAGQINGTSGYEEAAAQGLIAGINAARFCAGEPPLVLGRSQAYIGVLVDDLVTKEIDEPYRMFTSRAEHRLVLRSDNADLRLAPVGYDIGLVSEPDFARVERKRRQIDSCLKKLSATRLKAEDLARLGLGPGPGGAFRAIDLLKRPEIGVEQIKEVAAISGVPRDVRREAEVEVKYDGYIRRQLDQIAAQQRMEETVLPQIEYALLKALSTEARTKLQQIRPRSLGQAARIAGVSPADIAVIMIHIEQLKGMAAKT